MTRKLALALLVLFVTTSLFARTRAVGAREGGVTNATSNVAGVVESVSGNLVTLANGLVVLDARNARIVGTRGEAAGLSAIQRGTIIYAMLSTTDVPANAPLPASMIAVVRVPDVTLSGPVQSVDRAARTFTLLGRTVKVTDETSFGGFAGHRETRPTLDDLQTNMVVNVTAEAEAGALVATTVVMIAPIPPRPQSVRGTVVSIGGGSWVVRADGRDLTLVVNANTRITGSPKVGDTVEVIYNIDSSNANVAVAIIKHAPLPKVVTFRGVIKSIAATSWVITRDDDRRDVTVKLPDHIRFLPTVRVGERVEVVALENSDGTFTLVGLREVR